MGGMQDLFLLYGAQGGAQLRIHFYFMAPNVRPNVGFISTLWQSHRNKTFDPESLYCFTIMTSFCTQYQGTGVYVWAAGTCVSGPAAALCSCTMDILGCKAAHIEHVCTLQTLTLTNINMSCCVNKAAGLGAAIMFFFKNPRERD